MSKIATILAALFLLLGAIAATPTPAAAYWHHGHSWHGGSGFAFGWGRGGYPYPYYYGGPYYAAPACGWTSIPSLAPRPLGAAARLALLLIATGITR